MQDKFCGEEGWGPWKPLNDKFKFTDCFREFILEAGIPFVFAFISLVYILGRTASRLRKVKRQGVGLLNGGNTTSYGTISQQTEDDEADLSDDESFDTTLGDSVELKVTVFDALRLVFAIGMIVLFVIETTLRLHDASENKHGLYWVMCCWMQIAVWIYASVLAVANLLFKARSNILRLRTLLNLLYGINFVVLIIELSSLYYEYGRGFMNNRVFTIASFALNFCLVLVSLLEPKEHYEESTAKTSQEDGQLSPEVYASIYSQFMFSWVNPLIRKGFRCTLTEKDVYKLPKFVTAEYATKIFNKCRKHSITQSLLYTFRAELAVQFVYSIIWSIVSVFAPPYFLQKILVFVQDYPNNPDKPTETAYWYAVGLLLGSIIPSLAFQQALYIGRQLNIRIQAILIGEIYRKSLSRRDTSGITNDEESKDKTGKITDLMSVDAQKVSEMSAYIFYVYCYPLQIGICAYLLYQLLGVSALVGIVTFVIAYPMLDIINKRFREIQIRLMAATDKRMGVTNEFLQAIRIIKFFAWESQFKEKITEAREIELKHNRTRFMQWIYIGGAWMLLPIFLMLSVFFTYTKLLGHDLTAPVAFTALALFSTLRNAFEEAPSIIITFLQAKVSLDRIEKFLTEQDVIKCHQKKAKIDDTRIGFVNATFQWPEAKPSVEETANQSEEATNQSEEATNQSEEPHKFVLRDLNFTFPRGQLSIICGATGSGKTSVLMALLGEMECLEGEVILPRKNSEVGWENGGAISGIAYVAQTAWILNLSIRDNILFGLPYDEDRYNKVIRACALIRDLEIFEHGDKTEVGEKGITVSGGQKQRIALARAVYSQAEIIIMDDCLSAVDAHTARHLYDNCLTDELMENRTRILVTHHVGLCLRGASFVVAMKDGQLAKCGTPDEMLASGILNDASFKDDEGAYAEADDIKKSVLPSSNKDSKLMTEEKKAEGMVEWEVYKLYFIASGGLLLWVLLMVLFLITQVLQVGQDWWIKEWTRAYDDIRDQIQSFISTTLSIFSFALPTRVDYLPPHSPNHGYRFAEENKINDTYYLIVYALIGVATTIIATARSYTMFTSSLMASRRLHSALLDEVLNAKIRFFDTTPVGRIMNRFSSDMETIDRTLSPIAMSLIYACIGTATVIIIISGIMPQFLIAGAFITCLYVFIGAYYLATSRDLKRIESVTRSPIYTHFGETICGVATIRAFGAEKRFCAENRLRVDNNNRPFIYNWACNRWLHTRVDIAGALVSFFTAIIITIQLKNGMDPGLAGFALVYALTFTGHVIWILRLYALQEMNMNSVERVKEYLTLDREAARIVEGHRPPADWPRGEIKVEKLVMQYAPDDPIVLKDVSFEVKQGEKVGIVGRTGSGKSTLAVSFFRFMEATSGRIVIDGINISTIGLYDLRSRLTLIPQDPVLFSGTIRSNLDPFNEYTNAELWHALRRAHLIDAIPTDPSSSVNETLSPGLTTPDNSSRSQFNNLDAPVSENGNNFSQGQHQLIALARALVRRSKLIIMDEATASVDFSTDRMIQTTIREEFKESTLLCIAHRLRTVIDYDKILVLDAGEVVEFDHPHVLLQKSDSLFRAMCERSGESTELQELAKEKYEKDNR